jgi:hypothetical protein
MNTMMQEPKAYWYSNKRDRYKFQTPEQRARAYQSWRASIPFTDEQIITALDESANTIQNDYIRRRAIDANNYFARTRRLSQYLFALAAPFLIKTCNVCADTGKTRKALYRTVHEGRCSEHRHIKHSYHIERSKRLDKLGLQIEAEQKETNIKMRAAKHLHQTKKSHK